MSNLPLLWCLHACMQINFLLNTTNLLKHYWLREKFWILKQHLLWDGVNPKTTLIVGRREHTHTYKGQARLTTYAQDGLGRWRTDTFIWPLRAFALEDTCKIKWRKIPPKRDTSVESRSRTLVGRMPTTSICHLLYRRFSAIAYIFYVINPLFFQFRFPKIHQIFFLLIRSTD